MDTATDPELLDALAGGVAWIDRADRGGLEISGPDRAKLLHNLTTNEIKSLPIGRGCEAFVTSPQGKTLALVTLLATPERIILRTEPAGLTHVLPHLRKYGALDDVAIEDQSDRTFEWHLVGPKAPDLIRALGGEVPPDGDLSHHAATLAGKPVLLVRESPTVDPGLTVVGEESDQPEIIRTMIESGRPLGLVHMARAQFDALRIEAGTPASGREVTEANLPQELDRDRRAISFVKGCYLGQETVARLDALGHVNKILRLLRLESTEAPPPGALLLFGEKAVGTVSSAARSPRDGRAVALAYVRAGQAEVGCILSCRADDYEATATVEPWTDKAR